MGKGTSDGKLETEVIYASRDVVMLRCAGERRYVLTLGC